LHTLVYTQATSDNVPHFVLRFLVWKVRIKGQTVDSIYLLHPVILPWIG